MRARIEKALAERRLTLEVRRLRESYNRDLERQVQELSRKNQAMFLAQVQMAVTMLEAKDPYTRGHSRPRGRICRGDRAADGDLRPACSSSCASAASCTTSARSAPATRCCTRRDRSTDEEFVEIRRHTVDGEAMLSVLRADHPEVLHIVRWHHERLDGTGFPDGLVGDQIPDHRAHRLAWSTRSTR